MFQMAIPAPPGVLRQQPFYQGQMGVPGSDISKGIRNQSRGVTLYVDSGHNNATAVGDGTDPDNPLTTVQQAINNLVAWYAIGEEVDYSTIIVSGAVTESISVLDYTAHPSYVTIAGIGPSPFSPYWDSGAANSPCIVLGAVGWRVTGIRFYVPGNAAAVVVPCTQAPYGADAIGIRTVIDNCYFDGSVNTGLYGIDLHGAPYNVSIMNNMFGFINDVGACGIVSTNTGYADAYRTYISGNWFHESVGAIDASLNVSAIVGNVFSVDGVTAMTTVIDLRGGTQGESIVCGNCFGDADYSNVGGFYANAGNPGGWAGNSSEDTAEAEVGDNGWTIAPPT